MPTPRTRIGQSPLSTRPSHPTLPPPSPKTPPPPNLPRQPRRPLDHSHPPRANSRTERLTNSLRRGYITSHALSTRASTNPLSELVGPLAPERYVALPHRTRPAARALITVALAKGPRDVARLETFRRSGSVRGVPNPDITRPERAVDNPAEARWFDCVAAALLEPTVAQGDVATAVQQLAHLKLPPNPAADRARRAQLPREAFRLDRTNGIDFSPSVAPASAPPSFGRHSPGATPSQDGAVPGPSHVSETPHKRASAKKIIPGKKPEPVLIDLDPELPPVPVAPVMTPTAKAKGASAASAGSPAPAVASPGPAAKPISAAKLPESAPVAGPGPSRPTSVPQAAGAEAAPATGNSVGIGVAAGAEQTKSGLEGLLPAGFLADADQPLPEIDLLEPFPSVNVNNVDAIDAMDIDTPDKPSLDPEATQTQNILDDDTDAGTVEKGTPAMKPTAPKPSSAPLPPAPSGLRSSPAPPGQDKPALSLLSDVSAKGRKSQYRVPVSVVHDNITGQVSIDFDIVALSPEPCVPSNGRAAFRAIRKDPAQNEKAKEITTIELLSDSDGAEAACNVRKDGPTSMLQEMLFDLNNDDDERMGRRRHPDQAGVVNIDADDELEHTPRHQGLTAPAPKRPRRGKYSLNSATDRRKRLERAARMRSAVVETMKADQELRRLNAERGPALTVNGHLSHSKSNGDAQRRFSKRLRKSAPIVDSSDDGDPFVSKQADGDFEVPEEIEVPVQVPPAARASAERTERRLSRPSRRSQADVPRPQPQTRAVSGQERPKRVRSPLGARHSAEVVANERPISHRQSQRLWDREVVRVENLVNANTGDSPSVTSADECSDGEPFGSAFPILQRVLKPCKEGDACVLDSDTFDEHSEMMQFYRDSRNDPGYALDSRSPGTQFALECWNPKAAREEPLLPTRSADVPMGAGGPGTHTGSGSGGSGEGALYISPVAAADQVYEPVHKPARTRGRQSSRKASGPASSASRESSDLSSARSDSSDDADYELNVKGGQKRKGEATSADERAKDLQLRVCGEVMDGMEKEAINKVLKWAAKDFSWFDKGTDMMEIVAVTEKKLCLDCDNLGGAGERRCEESILLKLWKNLSWRKVRRMRHLGRGMSS